MSSKRILWISLGMLTLFVGALAYYFAVYVPAQTPAETQPQTILEKPASTESVVQSSSETPALPTAQEPLPTNSPTPTGTPETVPVAPQSTTATTMAISEDNVTQVAPLYVLTGHTDDVTEVAFSPDNLLVASSSSDGTVQLWNVGDGSLQHVLEGHTDSVNTLDFSPDGSLLASGSNDDTVRIWQVSDGTLVRTISSALHGRMLDVEFSPDGSLIAAGDHQCYVHLRRVSSGILYRTLVQPNCAIRQGGQLLTWGLAFSPDGEQIVTGEGRPCCGGSLQLWQVDDAYESPQLLKGYNLWVRDLVYSPDGSTLAAAFLGGSVFWLLDAEHGSIPRTFEGHTHRVNSVTFSPDGALLASGSRDQKVRMWRVEDGDLLYTLEGHTDEVNSVAISHDGSLIASGSDDDTVILWTVTSTSNQ